MLRTLPFRTPQNTISDAGLIRGGSGIARLGEVSLAHHGVLFLDEFPEFPRNTSRDAPLAARRSDGVDRPLKYDSHVPSQLYAGGGYERLSVHA
jgi:hypothetical protein